MDGNFNIETLQTRNFERCEYIKINDSSSINTPSYASRMSLDKNALIIRDRMNIRYKSNLVRGREKQGWSFGGSANGEPHV